MAVRLSPRLLADPVHFLALGAGSGLSPRAPGTAGSVVGLAAAWAVHEWPLGVRIALVAALCVAGVWICGASARRLGVHDHPGIVLDEICGMLATLLASVDPGWLEFALAFAFFRFFDIVKPWPIRTVDRGIGGGTGIMLDDLVAALYAAVCLTIARQFF